MIPVSHRQDSFLIHGFVTAASSTHSQASVFNAWQEVSVLGFWIRYLLKWCLPPLKLLTVASLNASLSSWKIEQILPLKATSEGSLEGDSVKEVFQRHFGKQALFSLWLLLVGVCKTFMPWGDPAYLTLGSCEGLRGSRIRHRGRADGCPVLGTGISGNKQETEGVSPVIITCLLLF